MSRFIFAAILVAGGIAVRTIWHTGDNVEFVTAGTLLSAGYLGLGWALIVPISIMVVTDMIIGNTNIFIFTWSAYLVIGLFGYWGLKNKKYKFNDRVIKATGLGLAASIWFYLWTNFGVWLLDNWGMYPKTLAGLAYAYWYGLPFFKYNLLGNLLFVPASFFIVEKVKKVNSGFLKKIAV